MTHPLLETALAHVERQLDTLAGALVANDAAALESGSSHLRMAAIAFAQAAEQRPGEIAAAGRPLQQRIVQIGQRLATQRESLARRQVVMDRAVASVLPPTSTPTYTSALQSSRAGMARKYVG